MLLPPWWGQVGMGGRGAVLPPTRTLPHQGGGERFKGGAHDIPTLVSTPPSPVEGEGPAPRLTTILVPNSIEGRVGMGGGDERSTPVRGP